MSAPRPPRTQAPTEPGELLRAPGRARRYYHPAGGENTARIPGAVILSPRPDFFFRVEGSSMNRLGLVTGSIVAIKAQPVAENGDVMVARLADSVTLQRYHRVAEKLCPKSTNPEHEPTCIDLRTDSFEVAVAAIGALIGDGFNRPGYDCLTR